MRARRDGGRRWLTHWLSASLILFLLLTALPLASLAGLRPPLRVWSTIHMSVGWMLLFVTTYRVVALIAGDARDAFGNDKMRTTVKVALLVTLIAVLLTGLVIYRPSPLLGPVFIFGTFQAAPIINVGHTLHLQLLAVHRSASFVVAALLVVHLALAFKRPLPGAPMPIRWLWCAHRQKADL